jgi:flagellar basal body-associated protein FliL
VQGQPAQTTYGYPQGQPQGGYVPPMAPGMYGVMPAVPKKRSRVGLIIGIVLGAVLLVCVGAAILVGVIANQAGKTVISTATKVAGSTGAPSGKAIVPSAAAILSNPQTSTDVDSNYNPTHVTSTFTTNQMVYVTFDIDSGSQDGFIEAKWYADGQLLSDRSFAHTHTHNVGLFSHTYTTATNSGVTELYWCTQSNCSDAQLAQVVHFTVTSSSFVPAGPNIARISEADRRLF